jgi:malonate-semialdehyde dehydrogenase (acetylating)/methylmalonate-semialdehyde dehydrogenase
MGAKNHAIIMPDADKEDAVNSLIGACFGSTGQRCMAISVAIMVGDSQQWIPDIVEKTKKLTTGAGVNNPDIAPLITKESKDRVERLIGTAEK